MPPDRGGQLRHGGQRGEVGLEEMGRAHPRCLDLGHHLRTSLRVATMNENVGTVAPQRQSQSPAEPVGGTGDKDHVACP